MGDKEHILRLQVLDCDEAAEVQVFVHIGKGRQQCS
jgi:hypothetical protein